MFDIGFWELVVIAVVALVVIGPERLPKAARIAGMWIGRARRSLASVKAEIDRELKAQELQEILRKQASANPLETILEEPRSGRPRAARPEESVAPGSARPNGSPETAPPDGGSGGEPASAAGKSGPQGEKPFEDQGKEPFEKR